MTREEAIQVLQEKIDNRPLFKDEREAVELAIEALSEPNMIPIKLEKRYPESRDEDITDAFMQGYLKGKADRPQGEWTNKDGEPIKDKFCVYCSKCKEWSEYTTDYCPNCGADMRGDNNE